MSNNPALFDIPAVTKQNMTWARDNFFAALNSEWPFSFIYDGQNSAELIGPWQWNAHTEETATQFHRTITITDPQTGLEVRAEIIIYLDTPGVDWIVYFTNTGTTPSPILEAIRPVDIALKVEDKSLPVLHAMRGSGPAVINSQDDFLPVEIPLMCGTKIELAPSDGRSSDGPFPFMNLQWGDGGVITAIGWTGQWIASIDRNDKGELHLAAGMQHLHVSLQPGETIRSPRILQIWWQGADHIPSYNLFRRAMTAHIVPRVEGQPVRPSIAYLADYLDNAFIPQSSAAGICKALEFMPEMGFESLWVDACWMRKYGMGDYGFPIERVEARDRFPEGLGPVGAAAHAAGMKFILWFTPEDILPETYLVDEHPEWIIYPSFQDSAPDANRGGYGMFDLSIPEAREFMTSYLNTVIEQYHMDCLRVDRGWFGGPLPCWRVRDGDNPARIGMTEMRGVEGLYKMWEDILAACPQVYIDNCAGGGRRIDLETCARSIPLWVTDYTTWAFMAGEGRSPEAFDRVSIQNQVMLAGISRYLPSWGTGLMFGTPYHFRSTFSGGMAMCEPNPTVGPDGDPTAGMREVKALYTAAIAEGKRIRPYYWGDFYPLTRVTTDPADWCVVQYHLPEEDAGIILAFRRHEAPESNFAVKPYAIDVDAMYEVKLLPDFEHTNYKTVTGAELSKLNIIVEDCPGSMLIEYKKLV
jgi:alpha-galactosidase